MEVERVHRDLGKADGREPLRNGQRIRVVGCECAPALRRLGHLQARLDEFRHALTRGCGDVAEQIVEDEVAREPVEGDEGEQAVAELDEHLATGTHESCHGLHCEALIRCVGHDPQRHEHVRASGVRQQVGHGRILDGCANHSCRIRSQFGELVAREFDCLKVSVESGEGKPGVEHVGHAVASAYTDLDQRFGSDSPGPVEDDAPREMVRRVALTKI